MAIDPSIALQAGKTQTQFDPQGAADLYLRRRQLANQEAIQTNAIAEQERKLAQQAELKGLMSGPGSLQEKSAALAGAGYLPESQELLQQEAQLRNSQLTGHAKAWEMVKDSSGMLAARPTEQNAFALLDQLQAQTGINFDNDKAEIMSFRNNPELIREYALRHGLSAEQQLAKIRETDLGGEVRREQVDPVTGKVISTETLPKTMSQAEQAKLRMEERKFNLEQEKFAFEKKKAEAGGVGLTKGQEALDKDFAKEYSDFVAQGGVADVNKNIQQLKLAAENLKWDSSLTGPSKALLPDQVRAFTNPKAIATREAVEEIAQRNLRLVLGAQFTQKEGERLIARAYNPALSTEENYKRVNRLAEQIQKAAAVKMDAARYFEQNGTLVGWKGKLPTLADFDTGQETPKEQSSSQFFNSMPDPAKYNGRRIRSDDGITYQSNGFQWNRVK